MEPIHKARELYNQLVKRLQNIYEEREAQSISGLLLEDFFNIKKVDLAVNEDIKFSDAGFERLEEALQKLEKNEPLQYVLGKAHFYGRDFKVDEGVLIPRPETEELVHLIINENKQPGLKLLDIGTGSGCIPITLEQEMNNPQVYSMDISEEALQIARQNAAANQAEVNYIHADIFVDGLPVDELDIVVSNPPYVREMEKEKMRRNVLDWEPEIAIFVPDTDPLIFYKRITALAAEKLKAGGKLYLEINEAFGKEMVELLEKYGFKRIGLYRDFKGQNRIVRGVKG